MRDCISLSSVQCSASMLPACTAVAGAIFCTQLSPNALLCANVVVKQTHLCSGPQCTLHISSSGIWPASRQCTPQPCCTPAYPAGMGTSPTSVEHPASACPCESSRRTHGCTLDCSLAPVTAPQRPSPACAAAVGVWMGSTPAAGSISTRGTGTHVPQERAGMASCAAAQSCCSTLR